MPLQVADWEAINRALVSLYRELDSEKHSRVMFETINALVPSDSIALQTANQHKLEDLSARTWPENHASLDQVKLIARYAHQSPYAAYRFTLLASTL